MSIKGVDAQIMVARTAEYSKDNNSEARRGEMLQTNIAAQGKEQEQHGNRMVIKTEETEQTEIRDDEGRRGAEDQHRKDGRRDKDGKPASDGELSAGVGQPHKIDIRI